MPKLTIKSLRERSPHDIADELGIFYMGDISPVPHGGYFYETANWSQYGYCSCVSIQEAEGVVYVELGTINRKESNPEKIRECYGLSPDFEVTEHHEIDFNHGYWGFEVDETFTFKSDNGEGWGNFPEFRIFQCVRNLLIQLERTH